MKLSDFDFDLPPELIAQNPTDKRDDSNLLIASPENHIKTKFYNIIDYFKESDLLVFNNSKVIKAKLNLRDKVSINLNKKISYNIWSAFAKPARKLKIGDEFYFDNHKIIITEKLEMGEIKVKFELNNISIFEFLDKYGEMPLPLYIKRGVDSHFRGNDIGFDNERYQTVYSKVQGSVAAPTAGLHFTDDIITKLQKKGVQTAFVTLHVGAGTFMPVKTENINEHKMHTEYCSITPETADIVNKAKQEKRRIIAVGTTSLRTLESSCVNGNIQSGNFETDIFITPGFKFQIVDMLLTNFHFPKSTLFMLICAFAGYKEMHELYKYAIKEKMRFFSYGDATLLYRKT
ncbi:MAG: tRNA preQ1(34) S-adenosylmethionine ribosyltransferase-isomerase QueA [Rickettsia endosymbiont of Argas persicus]